MKGSDNREDTQQFGWDNNNPHNYPQYDGTASGWGNNGSDSYANNNADYNNGNSNAGYNNMNNNQANFTDNSSYNKYPHDNYQQNNYYANNYGYNQTNYNQNSYSNNYYNHAEDNANNSYGEQSYYHNDPNARTVYEKNGFKIEVGKPQKTPHPLESYREPGDPQSAEIVWIEATKISKVRAVILSYDIILAMVLAALMIILPETAVIRDFLLKLLVLTFGIPFILYGVTGFIDTFFMSKLTRERCTYPVTAKIIDLKKTKTSKGGIQYYPIYKFCYADKIYVFTSERTCSHSSIGNTVEINININDPKEYYFSSDYSFVGAVLGLMVAILTIIILSKILFL